MLTFSNKSFVLGLLILLLFGRFFCGGIGIVESKVKSEELNKAAYINDGHEHPN